MGDATKYRPRGISAAKLQRERDIANAVHKAVDAKATEVKDLAFQLAKAQQEIERLQDLVREREEEVADLDSLMKIYRRHLRNAFRAAACEFERSHGGE